LLSPWNVEIYSDQYFLICKLVLSMVFMW